MINDENSTIAIVQQFIHELIESVESSCAKFGCRTYHPDDPEYAVEGMLSLTNSVHLGRFSPLNALALQGIIDDFETKGGGGVRDETFVSEAWMMLRERLRRFLVAVLLVTITSEQRSPCFICGYGYQVGSPLAKTSVQCHNFTSCTCNELALAGLEGSIPTENCSNVSSAILSTCDCQENTTQNATPFTNPSDAPIAPTIYPASTPPTITSVSVPTRPGGRSEIELDFLLSLFILVPCFCFCLVRCLMDNHATDVCRQLCTFYRAPARHYIEETQQNLPTIPVASPTVSIAEETQSRRPLVLAALFPKEGKLESDGHPHAGRSSNEKYDPQLKHYVVCTDVPDAVACSICMDVLVPTDDSVTGLCSHAYHRECIMNWLHGDHHECPNCRQPMWDPETYEMIEQCIEDDEWHSPRHSIQGQPNPQRVGDGKGACDLELNCIPNSDDTGTTLANDEDDADQIKLGSLNIEVVEDLYDALFSMPVCHASVAEFPRLC
ncbi:hypothetical protein MHU86_17036 [Fragilaria crotonensis]|nr:hypothetical protein MHU86_17036 [Fragilaria crotonensis]